VAQRPQNETSRSTQGYDTATKEGEPYEVEAYGRVVKVPAGKSADGDFNGAPQLEALQESEDWEGADVLDGFRGREAVAHSGTDEPPPSALRRAELETRRLEALERLKHAHPSLGERPDGERTTGSDTVALRSEEAPDEVDTEQALHAEIAQIDRALQRIDDGEYGNCLSCGNSISEAALDELPERGLCPTCERGAELG
jgi:RNA polymerase-binding transcription factor DksA